MLTQERLERLLAASPEVRIDTVVVDEAQSIGESTRGVLLETVLDRILERRPNAQVVFSGPLISNPAHFADIFPLAKLSTVGTIRPAVTQNIVMLNTSTIPVSRVKVEVQSALGLQEVADVPLEIALHSDLDKITYLSTVFGKPGSSIVYAAGKADAEKIALKIAGQLPELNPLPSDIADLISFVKRHVHKDYALVETLRKGVAFHYGHMPSLLRKELETHFKNRRIGFIVSTSTLLYGLNLPAKNIFLLKPRTGSSTPIDGPDFWNLAGRAGRMGKELEGNVFLIDYASWKSQPLTEGKHIPVFSALRAALVDRGDKLIAFLRDPNLASEVQEDIEVAVGKLILDHRTGKLERTIDRYLNTSADRARMVYDEVSRVSTSIEIPTEVISQNFSVSVFRQLDLLKYFIARLGEIPVEELMPAHPLSEFSYAQKNYRRAFRRIHTYLLKYAGTDRRHNLFSGLALRWMRGDGLPVLISSAIAWNRKNQTGKSTARVIRETMEQVEQDLRFRYVKYFTCYNSLLSVALARVDKQSYVGAVPDVPLYLEMGGSSGVMINLMALGLSRTSAIALSEYVTDKEMGIDRLRGWLSRQNFKAFDMPPACIRELETIFGPNAELSSAPEDAL